MAGIEASNGVEQQAALPEWVRKAQQDLAALRRDVNRSVEERGRIEQLDQAFGETIAQVNTALASGDQAAAEALMQGAAQLVVDIEELRVLAPTRSKLAALRGALPPMPSAMAA